MYEVATWLAYALAAVMMLAAIAAVILAGLALRFVAEFLRELGDGREEGEPQHTGEDPETPAQARRAR